MTDDGESEITNWAEVSRRRFEESRRQQKEHREEVLAACRSDEAPAATTVSELCDILNLLPPDMSILEDFGGVCVVLRPHEKIPDKEILLLLPVSRTPIGKTDE